MWESQKLFLQNKFSIQRRTLQWSYAVDRNSEIVCKMRVNFKGNSMKQGFNAHYTNIYMIQNSVLFAQQWMIIRKYN